MLSTEPPELKEFPSSMDNDLSINLLLCPNERLDKNFLPPPPAIIPWPSWKLWPTFFNDYEIPDTTMTNGFQDFLVKEQVQSSAHNCPFSGYPAEEELPPDPPQPAGGVNNSAINHANFHIELEGSRIHSMYLAFLAAWAMLSIAGIAAAVVASVPVIGCLLAAVIILSTSVIAASILAIAWFAGPDGSTSDPNRIPGTGAVGELHPGDYLVAFGTWVYDAGHNDDEHKPYPKKLSDGLTPNPLYGVDNPLYNKEEKKGMPNQMGWNELHPVKYLGKAYQCADQKQAEEWEHLITESLEYKVEEVIHLLESAWRFHPLVG